MGNISDRTIGKVASLATLAVGMTIGFVMGSVYRPQQSVQAQAVIPPTPSVQEVSPGVTTGTFGANLILAHQIATDGLIVNGFDIMKMQSAILEYLATRPLAEQADVQNIVNKSRASTIYRIKQPQQAPAIPAPDKK